MGANEISRSLIRLTEDDCMRPVTIALLILTAAVFGGLMAARDLTDNIWARALIAAVAAGGCYGLMSVILRRSR